MILLLFKKKKLSKKILFRQIITEKEKLGIFSSNICGFLETLAVTSLEAKQCTVEVNITHSLLDYHARRLVKLIIVTVTKMFIV